MLRLLPGISKGGKMRELIEIIKSISNIQFLIINSLLAICLLVRTVFLSVSKMPAKQIYLFTSPVVVLLSVCMAIASKTSVSLCLCLAIIFGEVFECSLHILVHRLHKKIDSDDTKDDSELH